MPANPNHARHHVSFPPPPSLGLVASHERAGGLDSLRASEDRRTSKRSHLRCGVLEGAASLAHPRAARMCGQAGPETIWHVMFAIPACLDSLTGKDVCWWDGWDRRVEWDEDEQRRRKRSSRVTDRQGPGHARRMEGGAWVTGGKGTRDRMDGGPEPAASAGGGIVATQSRASPALAFR